MPRLVNEIATKVFTRAFRGYDDKEVDAFLDDLMVEVDTYERELEKLRHETGAKQARSASANGREPSNEQTAATAQQMKNARELINTAIDDAKRIVDSAIEEAELIVADAKNQAQAILQNANNLAEERVRQANEEAEAVLDEARRSANFRESLSRRSEPVQGEPSAQSDPIRELSQRLLEIQDRLSSIEADNGKVVDFKQGSPRSTAHRTREPGKDHTDPVFSAFGREEFRASTRNPWSDWLPNTSLEHPENSKEVQSADGIRDDWNFTD